MDQLRAMQVFSRVVELGSFTKAANSLHLPKASVTSFVQQLEEHVRAKLLNRTTRRLSLTDDGAAYFDGARRLINDLADLDAGIAQSRVNARGRLRIDVPAAAGRHVLAPALPEFLSKYPEISIEIGSSDRPVDLILEGVDCVIRGGAVHDESLVAKKLGAFQVITCAAPSYLKKYGVPKHPNDLANHRAVNFFSAKTGRTFAFDFERNGEAIERVLSHQVSANDADTQIALAISGFGIMQYPRTRVLDDALKAKQLALVLDDWNAGEMPLYVMYPRNRHLSARVRVFVDWIVDLYATKFAALAKPAKRTETRVETKREPRSRTTQTTTRSLTKK
jgi:LysR family transcriptional regulator, regulator for bpeEF and oprC